MSRDKGIICNKYITSITRIINLITPITSITDIGIISIQFNWYHVSKTNTIILCALLIGSDLSTAYIYKLFRQRRIQQLFQKFYVEMKFLNFRSVSHVDISAQAEFLLRNWFLDKYHNASFSALQAEKSHFNSFQFLS